MRLRYRRATASDSLREAETERCTMSGQGRDWAMRAGLLLLAAVSAAAVTPSRAEPDAIPLEERARAVLEVHCGDCQELRSNGGRLDLGTLADDPRRIAPGEPDASRIYQHLLRDQALPVTGSPSSAPTPDDAEAVRDWIAALPSRDAACAGRRMIEAGAMDAELRAWKAARRPEEVADTRVLSLVHLWNACAPRARLDDDRDAAAILLRAVARRQEMIPLPAIGVERVLFAVRLSEAGLAPADWDRMLAQVPRSPGAAAVMPADWLAADVLSRPEADGLFDAASQRAVERLARAWTRDVDLRRAAAERAVLPDALAQMLMGVGGEFLVPARRLIRGTLTRTAWDSLSRALDGEAPPGSAELGSAVADTEIDVALWTNKTAYRPRDLVRIHAAVSKPCYLTLIDVDDDGKAIVLFPNELEPDNLVLPSGLLIVPGRSAGYQLRFDKSGTERIVAICQRKSRRPAGIAYDFERQRFATLGDWRAFLRTIPEREKKIRARETARAQAAQRRRRGRSPPPREPAPPVIGAGDPVAIEGRAAISIPIQPGGR